MNSTEGLVLGVSSPLQPARRDVGPAGKAIVRMDGAFRLPPANLILNTGASRATFVTMGTSGA